MREEVMMILKMLEEGKITAEQAASLIEAINEAVGLYTPEESSLIPDSDSDEPVQPESLSPPGRVDIRGVKGLVDRLSDLADVVDTTAFEGLAEKIRDTVESAIKSTDEAIGRIQQEARDRYRTDESDTDDALVSRWSKVIAEPLQSMFAHGIRVEKVIDGSFTGEPDKKIDVELSTLNGSITVEPWDEPGFRINVTATIKDPGADCESAKGMLEELLQYDSSDDSLKIKAVHRKALAGASLKVRLPKESLYDLDLKTQNGRVSLGDFKCRMIKVETSNGRIELDNTCGVIAELESSNGTIDFSGVTQRLNARTSNGRITVVSREISAESEYDLMTSNGTIQVQLADAEKVGYHIDAKTSLGRIVLDLPDLVYQIRDEGAMRREVIAETSGFSENSDRLRIKARTSNGQVRIMYG